MSNLYYYFNNQSSFYFNIDGSRIFGGDIIQITMPNNNSNQSIFHLLEDDVSSYYTLNKMYISLSFSLDIGIYQLILEGNKNDYTNNTSDKIIIMIPIFNKTANTIEGPESAITKMNNVYISSIFKNMEMDETYNFTYGPNQDSVDMNLFLSGLNDAEFYPKIIDSNNIYKVIIFKKSNLSVNEPSSNLLLSSLTYNPKYQIFTDNAAQKKQIKVESNGIAITTTTETDIYIDCSPTNNIGEEVDIYTSKNMDQLKLFKINDLKVWAFRFVTIFIILLIIILIIKLFQVTINGSTPTIEPKIQGPNRPT